MHELRLERQRDELKKRIARAQDAERAEPVTACNLQTDTSGDVRPGARATGLQGSICVPPHEERINPIGTLSSECRA